MKKCMIVMVALLYIFIGSAMLFAADSWTPKADVGRMGKEAPFGFSNGNKGYNGPDVDYPHVNKYVGKVNPDAVPASVMYADFTGYGIYKYNGSAWTGLHNTSPARMAATGTDLYVAFSSYGLYKYDGSAWSGLHTLCPTSIAACGTTLYATFPGVNGVFKWNGSAWSQISTTYNPTLMVCAGTNLYAAITDYGLYKYNGSTWTELHNLAPVKLTAAGSDLYAAFTNYGLFKYDGSAWSGLHNLMPTSIAACGTDLYAAFTGYNGIFKWNGSAWSQVSTTYNPTLMVCGDTDLYAALTDYGAYTYTGSAWTGLHNLVPASMAAAAMNADYISPTIGVLKYVPAGSFQRDANPLNISTITTPFRMSQYDITRTQFLAVIGYDPSEAYYSTGMTDPVQTVNWYHAIAFCNKLSIAEGLTPVYTVTISGTPVDFATLTYGGIPSGPYPHAAWDAVVATWTNNGYRLPTEMEWEWAAMGATSGSGYAGPIYLTGYGKLFAGSDSILADGSGGSHVIGNYAWTLENSSVYYKSHPVGTTGGGGYANELGLYDMSGNVFKWCWDWWAVPYPSGTLSDYRGAASGTARVLRGGSWFDDASYATVAYRVNWHQNDRFSIFGFRVVRP